MTENRSSNHRYAVLGADGFIGSAIVRTALSKGAEVIAMCIQDPWRLADINEAGLTRVSARAWYEPGFFTDRKDLLTGVDTLIHLGYRPPPEGLDPTGKEDHERRVNVRSTAELAEAAGDIPIVYASSADVYGAWRDSVATEETDPRPSTPYSVAKLEAEKILEDRATILRVATVYGPGELGPRAIPSFIKASLSGGTAVLHGGGCDIKDYVPLAAVAEAFVAVARSSPDHPRVLNISSGVGRTTADVLARVVDVVGAAPSIDRTRSPRAPSHLVVSPDRARREIGFDPDADFGAGLQEEADWLAANHGRWR